MECTRCGREPRPDDRFCGRCGLPLTTQKLKGYRAPFFGIFKPQGEQWLSLFNPSPSASLAIASLNTPTTRSLYTPEDKLYLGRVQYEGQDEATSPILAVIEWYLLVWDGAEWVKGARIEGREPPNLLIADPLA